MKINGHNLPDKVNVLGTEYKIFYDKNNKLKINGCDGYCEKVAKELFEEEKVLKQLKNLSDYGLCVIRHELIHAFIYECGLDVNCEWALKEELVDWIAIQFPKLKRCFDNAGV